MDIHKPRPWHSVREFLKEYLIIAVGVLTALAAEQAAETFNKAREAREANERVRAEMGRNLAYATERLILTDCLDARLTAVRKMLVETRGGPIPRLPPIGGAPFQPYAADEWTSAVQSGLHQRFSRLERETFPLITTAVRHGRDTEIAETERWRMLSTLADDPRTLDPATREQLLQTVALARADNRNMAGMARFVLAYGRRLQIAPATRDPDGSPATEPERFRARLCTTWP
jgi:hypothetical protein